MRVGRVAGSDFAGTEPDLGELDDGRYAIRVEGDRLQVVHSFAMLSFKDADPDLHFVLLAGVSKFSKVSLFSGLNNLHDITFDAKCC